MTSTALRQAGTRRPVALALVGKATEWVTLAALLTAVPRLLGPVDYGSFGLALALVTVGSAALSLGGPTVMARFVAAAEPAERAGLARALALRALRWRAAGLAGVAVVAAVLALVEPGRFAGLATAVVVAALVLDAAATLAFQVALGFDRAALWSFRYALQNLLLVTSLPALHALFGATGGLAAIAFASGGALVLGLVAIRHHLRGPSSPVPPEVTRFALLQASSGLLVQLLLRGGVVLVSLLAGARVQTGYAALSISVSVALTYATWQVFVVSLPRLSEIAARDLVAAREQLLRLLRRATAAVVPATVVAAAAAPHAVTLFTGSRFSGAGAALGPGIATVALGPWTGAIVAAAAVELRAGARLGTAVAGTLAFGVAAGILVPSHGAAGATTALLAGTAASAAAGAVLFRWLADWRLAVPTLAAVAAALAIGAVS